ncbi:MAG: sel1 repeat family protein [Gammaproteobacteria bacterium]|nr:sel1 repeat family protein [Gammaproteobacteria bacterium]
MNYKFPVVLIVMLLVFSCTTVADEGNIAVVDRNVGSLPAAVQWYLELAKQGDAEAQYNLGSVYETGFGVPVNSDEAVRWYKEASEQDHPQAQLKLGVMYILGEGTRQSLINGTRWVRSASENGNTFATLLYDKVLSPDTVQDLSSENIIKKIKPFIDLGENKSKAKLLAILDEASDKGAKKEVKERFTSKSKNTVGKEIEIGNRTPEFLQSEVRTVRPPLESSNLAFLQREANAGNPAAQFELGKLHDAGNKLERDRVKALAWYNSAAKQGHAESQYRLAKAYIYGLGVEKDSAKGEQWLTDAAKQGHKVASAMLPIYLSHALSGGMSVAVSWYLEKAVNGESDGQIGLGYLYENGWGLQPSVLESEKWYNSAQGLGDGGTTKRLKQIKPSLPASSAVNKQSFSESAPATNTALPRVVSGTLPVPEARQTQIEKNLQGNPSRSDATSEEQPGFFSLANFTQKSALTPIILVAFGLIMGVTVYRWMRRSNYKNSLL